MTLPSPPPLALATPESTPPTTRCYWVVPNRLLGGAYLGHPDPPKHRARIEAIFGAGIRTVVSLMEENEKNNTGSPFVPYVRDVQALARANGTSVACVRSPIVDGSVTTPEMVRSILDVIDLSLEAGRPVFVHCFGGIGRTGTIVGCWLMRHGLASSDDVLEVLARLRQADVERRHWKAPEAAAQVAMVRGWREP